MRKRDEKRDEKGMGKRNGKEMRKRGLRFGGFILKIRLKLE